ncbi:hypothetical protein EB796_017417 [Bugula neritina]|uniref:Uncharacterized protein n=1 Tax=Bugula neritina TaxID=10212 RepID=A0A7J7JF95_BUGNE|nr:hypothetical protein EB796_017417 [Bugula neritina]
MLQVLQSEEHSLPRNTTPDSQVEITYGSSRRASSWSLNDSLDAVLTTGIVNSEGSTLSLVEGSLKKTYSC